MTPPAPRAGCHGLRRRNPGRGQGGFTVLELMIGLTLSVMILAPLFAWTQLVLRQQPITRDGLLRTAETGLVGSYLPNDVRVAGAADDFPITPAPLTVPWDRARCQPGGRVLLMLLSGGANSVKTEYVVAPSSDSPSRSSIWRTQCAAAGGGPISSRTEVFEDVDPSLAATFATCWSSTVAPEPPCRQVGLTFRARGQTAPVVLRATRRADVESLSVDPSGNRLPSAKITVVSQTLVATNSQRVHVLLDARGMDPSTDSDGSIVHYRWQLPNRPVDADPDQTVREGGASAASQEWELPSAGTYSIELTVTDDDGATNTAYKRVVVQNRAPIAAGTVSPGAGTAGVTSFMFDASTSNDPDGSIGSYRWTVTAGSGSDQRTTTFDGPTHSKVFGPEWGLGVLSVVLTVTDNDGTTGTKALSVTVDPVATTTTTTIAPSTTSTTSTTVPSTVPGPIGSPTGLHQNGTALVWDRVADATGYQVRFELPTAADCTPASKEFDVGAEPVNGVLGKNIPASWCGAEPHLVAFVGAKFADGPIVWAAPIDVTATSGNGG